MNAQDSGRPRHVALHMLKHLVEQDSVSESLPFGVEVGVARVEPLAHKRFP
jgi:hypothetical protein